MGKSLKEVAEQLKKANKRVQLIYAFNGTGKTRLSREFKKLVPPKNNNDEDESRHSELFNKKILYYSAFTEDLFYWDNDLESDTEPKLKIQPNAFTKWVFQDQGQDRNVITNFQRYTNEKLTPHFNNEYTKEENGYKIQVPAFTEVTFSFERGNELSDTSIKISKGEESNFVWSIFYTLFHQVIEVLNIADTSERETEVFNNLEYVFVDDPVSSLDENHLIELAVDLAELIKSSQSDLKFIITTHNPLFFNVLSNEFNNKHKSGYKSKHHQKYRLEKLEDGNFSLIDQAKDSPFSYHLYLLSELDKVITTGDIKKYHFNFIRNILEKTSTFLGYNEWKELLPNEAEGSREAYYNRIINLSSHSKHAGEETSILTDADKRVLGYLVNKFNEMYKFKNNAEQQSNAQETE
ncbi:MAG: AAA family ATPase [Sphingobacteriaceae bacterium]|nr:AAA family ATPase [Sphingobacteriaceae bacterium]